MIMNYEKEINDLNDKLNTAKEIRNKATWRLEELKKEQKNLEDKIRELGLEPSQLEAEISKLDIELKELLREANNLLPKELNK